MMLVRKEKEKCHAVKPDGRNKNSSFLWIYAAGESQLQVPANACQKPGTETGALSFDDAVSEQFIAFCTTTAGKSSK
jgi:hypothetical protein